MNLHEVRDGKPDWDNVPTDEMNVFQKVAAKTDGWATISNAIDAASFALTVSANEDIKNNKLWKPFIKLSISGLIDLADGAIAEVTKTKGPKGKLIDAAGDKYRNTSIPLALALKGVIPKAIAYPIVASEIAIALGAGAAYFSGNKEDIQASANGKKAKFELSLAVASHMLSKALENSGHTKLSKATLLGSGALYALSVMDAKKVAQDYVPKLLDLANHNNEPVENYSKQ